MCLIRVGINAGRNRGEINGMYNLLNKDFICTISDTVNVGKMIELFKKTEKQYPDTDVFTKFKPYRAVMAIFAKENNKNDLL